jgi:nitroreductase
MTTPSPRQPEYNVAPVFVSRWSSRALSGKEIPDEVLFSTFEAARWAPSAGNAQPWHFLYSKRESPTWPTFFNLLFDNNKEWASRASALIVVLSRTVRQGENGLQPLRSHSFDTGAAWANLALQATKLGWSTRGIGGLDRDAARIALSIPDEYEIQILIAIGQPTSKSVLPDHLQSKDQPTDRRPISSFVAQGTFSFA